MRYAYLYKSGKTATQSGSFKEGIWTLRLISRVPHGKEPLMGYYVSKDTSEQIILSFASKDSALRYAQGNLIQVIETLCYDGVTFNERTSYIDRLRNRP